ncbi:hypothetical protein N1031_09495 [Herbiconiux moechotypicola]|uniref:Uncharacterized protein n=1 Tax=Herbiconiux moechotypicola TaxID=637393 RepID=A0ABP5QFG2_9MICO|nr:hypothetical protein [Herbiconiux moechotypicola]MCS5729993.1 hypothetical protein [Herbiconiux moechotypicola]
MILELLEVTGRLQELGAILYVIYSVSEELRWRPLRQGGEWGAPTILGVIGAVSLLNTGLLGATAVEWMLVVAAVLVALACGALAGRAARFRPLSETAGEELRRRGARRRRKPRPLPVVELRTGWIGALLWAVTLASRYGAEFLGERLDAPLATTVGLALLLVAVNEAARVAVIEWRSRSAGHAT